MYRAIRKSFKNWMSFLLIFCVLSPSVSPVLAAPFWERWQQSEEASVPEVRRTKLVSILVEESLLENDVLRTKIERYGVDVQNAVQGQVILVPVARDTSPLDLWNGNAQLYFSGKDNDQQSQLIGSVFIGDIPLPIVDKEGRLHATPFPLVDFEDPSYMWDIEKERFVWGSGGDDQAEVWHGIIRSDATTETSQINDLKQYLDRNHAVHQGKESFSKKVFVADIPAQRRGISDQQKKMYQNWIDHLEDFSYLRFNKNWLNGLFADMNPAETLPMELLPDSMKDADTSADFSAMPDIQTKFVIDQMAQRYIEAAGEKIVEMLAPAAKVGRWESGEMDTTIGLIAQKDEWASLLLREANDEVETILRKKLTDPVLQIPAKRILKTEHKYQPYQNILGVNTPFGVPITKELYVNGVELANIDLWGWDTDSQEMKLFDSPREFPAENCSFVRGSVPDEEHPAAQMAELNRAYNFETATLDSCVDWDGEDTEDSDREDHEYEGCCAKNISFGGTGFDLSSPDCTINGDGWSPVFTCEKVGDWQCGLSLMDYPLPFLMDWEHIGATKPIFDLKGSRPVESGVIGAQGCEDFFEEEGESAHQKEISTLMFHDEPRLETLQAQAAAQTVNALPADDARGVSFYDAADVFHRIDFPSAFDLIGTDASILLESDKQSFFATQLEKKLTATLTNIENTSGNAGKLPETLFDNTLWKNSAGQQELLDALLWLGKDLEQKHNEVLRAVLSDTIDGARILHDESFNGYEVLEIIAQEAESETLRLEFEKGDQDMESSNTFQKAKRESDAFVPLSEESWIEEEQGKGENILDGWEAKAEDEECSGINILTWPTKCLVPWVSALPNAFTQTLSLPFDVPVEEEEIQLLSEGNTVKKQDIVSLQVSPKKIILSANDVTPITISVEIKDEQEKLIMSSEEVSLKATSADALDFFTISPAGKRIAVGGKTQFSLLPKTRAFGGKFAFQISVGEKMVEIPVSVIQTELKVSADTISVIAGETSEVNIQIHTLDLEQSLSKEYDGKWIQATSDIGTIMGAGRVKLKNGGTSLTFLPGTKAGKGVISIQDEEKQLPIKEIDFEVLPTEPSSVRLEVPPILVLDGAPIEAQSVVVDRFGNEVFENIPTVEWDISDTAQGDIEKNTVLLSTKKTNTISVASTFPQENSIPVIKEIPVIERPQLLVDVQQDSLEAGAIDAVLIPVSVEGELPGLFEIDVSVTGEAGIFPPTIMLNDGIGNLSFIAGTHAGRSSILLHAPGFGSTTFTLDVRPSTPHKIEMSTERTILQIDDERRATLSLRVVDRFGNEVPSVERSISLIQNPGEKIEISDLDELESLGVLDSNSSVKQYLEEQLVETEMTTNPVVEFIPSQPKITNGMREVEIQTTPTESGHIFLIATAEGLIPDTLELDVVHVLKQDEFKSALTPKSLLTLFLGNAGGDQGEKSFGNRFLFQGKTQAVATLLEDPEPDAFLFSLDPEGEVHATTLTAETGNMFSFQIDDIARATIQFEESSEWNDSEGWNFSSVEGKNILPKDASLWLDNQKIITLLPGGGFYLPSGVELVPSASWKEWNIQFKGEVVGTISLVLEKEDIFTQKESQPGVFIESLLPEVYVRSFFTGKSLTESLGVAGFHREQKEDQKKMLQSSRISAEDALEETGVGWTTPWMPGAFFAAGNMAGESVHIAASDAVVLLGDPTITVQNKNSVNSSGFSDDIGRPLWTSPFGPIDQVLSGDLNGDGRAEIFSRIGNKLFVLFHDRHQLDNFRDTGLLLRFADGAKKVVVHTNHQDSLLHFLQLNDEGKIILHTNKNQGTLVRKTLDVGISASIVDFDIVELNGDQYSDLILLDSDNTLWFAYGKDDTWYSAQEVESFASSFEKVDETYVASKEQEYPKTTVTKFPQLDEMFVRFADISESSTWSGNMTRLNNREFSRISDARIMNARYQAEIIEESDGEGTHIVVPGKRFSHKLRISGNTVSQKETEFVIPKSVGFQFQKNSFVCEGCETLPEVNETSRTIQINVGNLPLRANLTFRWETVAEEIDPIRYTTADFSGSDGRDDVAIAWQSDGTAQTIQFLSSGKGAYPMKSGGENPSPFLKTHRRQMTTVFPDLLPADFDAEATAEDVLECIGTQQTSDGTPTMLASMTVEEGLTNLLSNKKKTSWIDAIPSIALLAPGPQSIYIPPFSIPIPIPAFGMPVLWVGPSPPFVGAGPNPTSMFRLYVMPTTSLQVGLGICGGPVLDPTMTPTGIPFPPQCIVIVPQFPRGSSSGGGNTNTGGGTTTESTTSCTELEPANTATAEEELLQQLYAPTGDGRTRLNFSFGAPFSIKPMKASTNRQIKAADILSQWVQDQWRELTNFKFPKFKLKIPEFKTQKPSADESVLSQLKKSPFVDIQTKKITINYPSFSDEKLKHIKQDAQKWKKDAAKKIEQESEKWNELTCSGLENGVWKTEVSECESDPSVSSALEILVQLSDNKATGTVVRIESLSIQLALLTLEKKKELLIQEFEAEKTRMSQLNENTLSDWQSEILKVQEKMKDAIASPEMEKQASLITTGKEKVGKLDLIIEDIESLQPSIEKNIKGIKNQLASPYAETLAKQKSFQADIEKEVVQLEALAQEIDALHIQNGKALIQVSLDKIAALSDVSEGDKQSAQDAAAENGSALDQEVVLKNEELKATATEELGNAKASVNEAFLENKAVLQETKDDLRNAAKDLLAQITTEPLLEKWEELQIALDTNVEALESYITEIKKLKTVPEKLEKLLEQIQEMANVVNEYWSEWIEKNESAVEKWEEFSDETKKAIQAWKEIPEILKKFAKATSSSNGGSMTRGTLLAWLKNFILSAIKFPIIPMPQVPDVEIDLSEVKIGMKIEVPELEFNEVKISPEIIPPSFELGLETQFTGIFGNILSSFWKSIDAGATLEGVLDDLFIQVRSGEISPEELNALLQALPSAPEIPDVASLFNPFTDLIGSVTATLPVIPVLPKAPSLPDMAFEMPPLVLPQLPSLIEPPKFPDFLKVPNLIMLVPKYLLAFLGLISRGIMPVPEWMVAMTVVNATNRTLLLPIDFLPGATLPAVPKLVLPTLSYKLKWEFAAGIPSLVAMLEASATMFNSVTTQLSNASKGMTLEKVIPIPAAPIPLAQAPDSEFISLLPEETIIEQDEFLEIPSLKILALDTTKEERSRTHSWHASTSPRILSIDDYPQSVPSTYDLDSVPDAADEIVVAPRILWFDSQNNTTEVVTTFPLQGRRFATQRIDLDRDGEDEMIYSIGEQLFLKRRIAPRMTEEESDAEFEVPDTIIEWDMSRFIGGFSPSQNFSSSMKANGSTFQFLPDQINDARYFEWIVSERPDRIFESSLKSTERMSSVWRRMGFLVRPPATKYEIRPVGAQIQAVEGHPIMYGMPLKTVPRFEKDQCADGETVLPFFGEETLFVGGAEKSRLLIKTLARQGQQTETREIELRKGEETVVDFAEVCLSRGEVDYIELAKTEKMTPKKDDYFFSGMRLELGEQDRVDIDLFDNTEITVWGGEQYELHQFNSREDLIARFRQLSRENYYGQLVAFQGKNKSWTRSKYLLHDPQTADDTTAPQLEAQRGTARTVALGQPIEINASASYENQEFARVWWEARGKIIIDSNAGEYAPLELLKIMLPAEYTESSFPITLHAEDISGNRSELIINIEVRAPELKLREASARDAQVSGKIVSGEGDVEVWLIRERDGRKEILSQTTKSKKDGTFLIENLSRTGGALLRDEYTKEPLVEVLKSGRPILSSEKISQIVSAAKDDRPLHISLRESTGKDVAEIQFVAPKQPSMTLPETEGLLKNIASDQKVTLSNPKKEQAVWKMGEQGISELWERGTEQILGRVDTQGQFSSEDSEVYLKIQPAVQEKAPLIFEIWKNKYLLAQFSMPIPKKIKIQDSLSSKKETIKQDTPFSLEKKIDVSQSFLQTLPITLEKEAIKE